MLNYGQKIPSEMLAPIATYLGEPVPSLPAAVAQSQFVQNVEVVGVLAMGQWHEPGGSLKPIGDHFVPTVPDPRYASRRQYALIVATPDLKGLQVGDYAIFVSRNPDEPIQNNQIVHIETNRGGLIEDTPRRVQVAAGKVYLHHDLTENGIKNRIEMPNPNIKIAGFLIGTFRAWSPPLSHLHLTSYAT
jgi:hypothetical protein